MALRIARGLFRLWLVLSVLWIGGAGVMTWRTYPIDEEAPAWVCEGFNLEPGERCIVVVRAVKKLHTT